MAKSILSPQLMALWQQNKLVMIYPLYENMTKAVADFMNTGKVKKFNLHTFNAITPCKKQMTQKRISN